MGLQGAEVGGSRGAKVWAVETLGQHSHLKLLGPAQHAHLLKNPLLDLLGEMTTKTFGTMDDGVQGIGFQVPIKSI